MTHADDVLVVAFAYRHNPTCPVLQAVERKADRAILGKWAMAGDVGNFRRKHIDKGRPVPKIFKAPHL